MGAFWGSLAAIGIGMSELFGRRVVNAAGAVTGALVMQIIGMFTALVSVLFFASEFATDDMAWGALSGFGMASGLGCYFSGVKRSSAAVVSPTVATLAAVIPFVYTIIRGSDVSGISIIGAAIAFVGLGIIAAGTGDAVGLRSGVSWGVVSGVSYGLGLSVLVEVSDEAGVWPAVSQRLVGTVVLGVAALLTKSLLWPPRGERLNGLGAGVFAGLSSVFALIGLAIDAPPTVVTQSMFPVVSVVVGFWYFGDPVARRQVAGIALVLVGIIGVVAG
jgi:drug/metabolite transporter (DMT)-like permease